MAPIRGAVVDKSHIKILHVFPTFGVGGQQIRLALLAESFGDEADHTIISLTTETSARAMFPGDAHIPVSVIETPKSKLASNKAIHALKEEIKARCPDILCTYNWGAIEAVLANRLSLKLPHIHFEDGFGPDENLQSQKLQRVLMRRLLLRQSVTVVPSKGLQNLALTRWKLPQQRVQYIPNGIDLDRFAVKRDYQRSPLVIGSVGTVRREKNFGRLLRAFGVSQTQMSASLEIVGDGPERSALMNAAEKIGGVTFSGQNNQPEKAYEKFDIFAMSSDTEQMPLSLMEAMAAGLPVAATDVGDIADMVSEENRRFITPKEDEHALAASLAELAGDPVLRQALGQANLAKAQCEFSLEMMVGAYRTLFESVLG